MPKCCSVSGCRSNYRGEKEYVTIFSLPKDELLRKKWLRSIPTDFKNVKNPQICLKHFHESSIIRTDRFLVNGVWKEFPRKIPKLLENSIPTIFPNLPEYLTTVPSTSRRLSDVEKSNVERAIENSIEDHKKYISEKSVTCIQDVSNYYTLNKDKFKNEWSVILGEEKLVFCYINISAMPCITASLTVYKNLEFDVYLEQHKVLKSRLPDTCKILNSVNVIDDLINYIENHIPVTKHEVNCLDTAIQALESCDPVNVQFVREQLKLHQVSKYRRSYSGNTMVLAALLFVHSTSAYCAIYKQGLLCMPHYRTMQKLVGKFSLTGCSLEGSIRYLKSKIEHMKPCDKVVNLLLDEIYIEPQYNFKGGSIYGTSELDCSKVAKTCQVFMISSAFSKYKDVVSIVPVNNMKAEQLKEMSLKVLTEVEATGLQIISLISDNNAVNRKAFELFTPNKILQPYISHPVDNSRLLFFIFDPVHILKCVKNNWSGKKNDGVSLEFPDTENYNNILSAKYKHLETLYKMEKNVIVKYGHKLSSKALYPSNIQKQNVKLALNVINEENVAALNCAAKSHPEMFPGVKETCTFLQTFSNWWRIVNVQSPFEGKRFNDTYREPVRGVEGTAMEFLKALSLWLKNWRMSVSAANALSPQTFQSLITTTDAFIRLIPYLFETYKIDYVLLGKFQNDNLEGRFGNYRQLSGANYYISYIQLLESERKIRFKNAVIFSSSRGNIELKSLLPSENLETDDSVNITAFLGAVNGDINIEETSQDLLQILTYICGYVVMKELHFKKCVDCQYWLQLDKEMEVDANCQFINELDRGKLTIPTHDSLHACVVVWHVLQKILNLFENDFLSTKHQLSILYKLSLIKLSQESSSFSFNFKETCQCKRSFQDVLQRICLRTSRILLSNLVKSKNDFKDNSNATQRKVKKLRSN